MDVQTVSSREINILIVDDVTSNLMILAEIIRKAGYVARPVTSAGQAMRAIEICLPQLILLDVSMPEVDGFEFCSLMKSDIKTRAIPIIFISALNSPNNKIKGFNLGAVDYISKPFEVEEVTSRINTHLQIYNLQQELKVHNKKLHKLVNSHIKKISDEQKSVLFALAKLTESRDDFSDGHLSRVARNAKVLAMSLQLSDPEYEDEINNCFIDAIELAASLHDIGMITVSDSIILKPGKITEEELEKVKCHTTIGAKTLSEIYNKDENTVFIKMAIEISYSHHEKWDGSGYPDGIKGEEIPLAARILSIIDVFDVLVHERAYKPAFSLEESLRIIREEKGISFDPKIADVFLKIQNQLKI